jgi:hypothetical protein
LLTVSWCDDHSTAVDHGICSVGRVGDGVDEFRGKSEKLGIAGVSVFAGVGAVELHDLGSSVLLGQTDGDVQIRNGTADRAVDAVDELTRR